VLFCMEATLEQPRRRRQNLAWEDTKTTSDAETGLAPSPRTAQTGHPLQHCVGHAGDVTGETRHKCLGET
jgi:hypothetical protein